MSSLVAYYTAASAVIIALSIIFQINGQPTVEVYEKGDSSNIVVEEMHQLRVELLGQLNKAVLSIHRLLNETNIRGRDISIRKKTQIFWKRETAFATDVGEVPIFVSFANDWIVLMNRFDGSLNFNRNWTEYKNGFGDIRRGEFWLGNEKIHRLTNTHGIVYTLHLEVQPDASDQWYYADYDTFSIDSESNKYTLHLSGYNGNAGDSLTNTSESRDGFHGGMNFTTSDNDNDRYVSNCAMTFGGGWWFNYCHHVCLTCSYNSAYSFRWLSLRQLSSDGHGKLRAARMMIKSK